MKVSQIPSVVIVNNLFGLSKLFFPNHIYPFFLFDAVCLKCYSVSPQTNIQSGFKRGKETRSVLWSDFTVPFQLEPRDSESGYRHGLWWRDLRSDANETQDSKYFLYIFL